MEVEEELKSTSGSQREAQLNLGLCIGIFMCYIFLWNLKDALIVPSLSSLIVAISFWWKDLRSIKSHIMMIQNNDTKVILDKDKLSDNNFHIFHKTKNRLINANIRSQWSKRSFNSSNSLRNSFRKSFTGYVPDNSFLTKDFVSHNAYGIE